MAEEVATSTNGARPDNLEVHEDSMAIVQATLSELRGPAMIAGAVVGASILLLFGVGLLSRRFSNSE